MVPYSIIIGIIDFNSLHFTGMSYSQISYCCRTAPKNHSVAHHLPKTHTEEKTTDKTFKVSPPD